jgi:hypothetical protein
MRRIDPLAFTCTCRPDGLAKWTGYAVGERVRVFIGLDDVLGCL